MHTEHLSNVHPGWVVGGWLASVAAAAALYLAGAGLGLVRPDASAAPWVVISLGGGFFLGGLLVGMRWSDAPILHGTAITLLSVLVWFVALVFGGPGAGESVALGLGLILVQLAAACGGAWFGRWVTLGAARPD